MFLSKLAGIVRPGGALGTTSRVAESPAQRSSTFQALRHRDFRFYWLGMFASVFGQTTEFLALGWLVLQLTGSPFSLGVTGLAQAVPNVTLTFVGGALADRVDRRRLLLLTQSLAMLLFLGLGGLVVSGVVQVWHAYVFAFVLGCVRAFDSPSRQAIVVLLLPKEEIPAGVALINLVWQLPRLVGPAVAGIMIAAVGVGPTLFMAGGGTACAVVMFVMMRLHSAPPASRQRGFLMTVIDGVNYIRRDDIVFALIGLTFFNSVFGMSYIFLLPVFARDILNVGSQGYGFLQTASACGGILGVLVAARLATAGRRGWQAIWGAVAYGLLLVAFAASSWYPLSLGLILLISVAHQIYMTVINTVLLLIVPDEFRGRVLGVYGLAWSLVPLGAAVTGTIAEFAGTPASVALGGALVAAMAVAVAIVSPRVHRLD